MPFLDILLNRTNGITTSVYTKPTKTSDCLNYKSICPDRYKTGIIKTLLSRAYKISSDWNKFHKEMSRIKQLLTNNNYPMQLIDSTINKFLSNITLNDHQNNDETIKIYFRNQMSTSYKQDEQQLKNIILSSDDKKIKLTIYYSPKKSSNLFIKNRIHNKSTIEERDHVVYQWRCIKGGCNTANNCYIGMTTCSLKQRFSMHTQKSSSIYKHLHEAHNISKTTTAELIQSVRILMSSNDRRDLIFTEAILIKQLNPSLNAQNEGADRILKIFKH